MSEILKDEKRSNKSLFILVNSTLFAVAMGYLEAVVVVYLRTILTRRADWKPIEITREAATLIMLVAFSMASGQNKRERFGVFLWIFGVWDIVYYVGLWIWLRWPNSLLTMDTLFYIPCTWSSPVYIPVFFSGLMILAGALLILERGIPLMRTLGLWALIGWLIGLAVGMANALFRGLPVAVSAMGFSFYLGLASAGAGWGIGITRSVRRIKLPCMFAATFSGGMVGGFFGHLARTMFYTTPASILWPMGLGALIGIAGMLLTLVAPLKIMKKLQTSRNNAQKDSRKSGVIS